MTADCASTSVFAEVDRVTRACVYDRPGAVAGGTTQSRSSLLIQPITTVGAVADLQAMPGPVASSEVSDEHGEMQDAAVRTQLSKLLQYFARFVRANRVWHATR
jgi:hypothetical protein